MLEIWVLLSLALFCLYWLASIRCKDIAVATARRECKLCDVQLLDQTVHQVRISLSRDVQAQWRVWRKYRFEYSHDGELREKGSLVLLGQRVIRVDMDSFNSVVH